MKTNMTLKEKLLNLINAEIRTALAEEVPPVQPEGSTTPATPPVTPATPSVDFETLISKARSEEKEKLYPEINKLKEDVNAKVARINELLLTIGEKDETISQKDKEIKELKTNSKKSSSQEVQELNLKVTQLENQLAEKDTQVSQIKLDSYKQTKMALAGGNLIPELVVGSSEEEIDLAIEKAKTRYAEIVQSIAPAQTTVIPTTNQIPPVSPSMNAFSEQVSTQSLSDINLFTPEGRKQYAEMRAGMGLK